MSFVGMKIEILIYQWMLCSDFLVAFAAEAGRFCMICTYIKHLFYTQISPFLMRPCFVLPLEYKAAAVSRFIPFRLARLRK